MRSPFAFLLCAAGLAAQQAPARPDSTLGHLVDSVAATVNDDAILVSTVRTTLIGKVNELEKTYGRLSAADLQTLQNEALRAEIDRHRMAQSVKSLGALTPEQIEQIVAGENERQRDAAVRDVGGSIGEYTREMARQRRTWPLIEQDKRTEQLHDLFREIAVSRRLGQKTNLYVTPRMLREAFQANRDRFVRDASATVLQVRFTGPDAQANAERAAAVWRQEDLTPRQLAERFPPAIGIETRATSLSRDLQPLATFALAGPNGNVSEPLAAGGAIFVAKVADHRPARNGRFEDADVQDDLRDICLGTIRGEFARQAMRRAEQRTEVWLPR
jgi:hypothetical protein